MARNGRIVAVTHAPGGRTGSWQPWAGMGTGKAALESLCRYFAVALAKRGITVNAVSPGLTEDSVLNGLPREVQDAAHAWHEGGWTPMGRMGSPADIGNAVASVCTRQPSSAEWLYAVRHVQPLLDREADQADFSPARVRPVSVRQGV